MSWVSVFAGFLVAHMVGDYLLQTDWQARHKRCGLGGDRVARRALLTHVTTYTLAFVPALIWIADELDPAWAIVSAVLIFLPHLVIDDGRVVAALPEPGQARQRLRGGPGRLGRPVVPRAVAVARGDAGGRGMKRAARALCAARGRADRGGGRAGCSTRRDALRAARAARRSTRASTLRGAQDAAAGRRDRRHRRQDARAAETALPLNRKRHAKVIEQLTRPARA